MTHSYLIKGITCESCVAEVKNKLLMHSEITAVDIALEGQKAAITTQRHLSVAVLQEAIGADTKYKISEDTTDHSHGPMEVESDKSWLATYKPLLIIFLFITSVSILTADGNLHLGMGHFMAGFFLVFSFFKLLDLRGFASSYAMYDLLASRVSAYGYVYPFIELGLGLLYLIGLYPLMTSWATVCVMGFSSIGVIQSVLDKKKIKCACLGAVFNLPMSSVTIIEDLLMVGMAGTMLL
jgi:copper chaperone CopZ